MSVATYEAIVEQGQIKLPIHVRLPEHAKIYVVVPNADEVQHLRFLSPRLKYPEQAVDFVKEVIEESDDASV